MHEVLNMRQKGLTFDKTFGEVRDALHLSPGDSVDFDVNDAGQVVVRKAGDRPARQRDRFESARGKAEVKWRTDELMALLRGTD